MPSVFFLEVLNIQILTKNEEKISRFQYMVQVGSTEKRKVV